MLRSSRRLLPALGLGAAASLVTLSAATSATQSAPAQTKDLQPITENQVLGDSWMAADARKHRVALTSWPVRDPRSGGSNPDGLDWHEPRSGVDATARSFETPDDFCRWLKASGYDGMELAVDDFRARWMEGVAPKEIVRRINQLTERHGTPVFGSLYHVTDGNIGTCGPQNLDFQVRFLSYLC